MNQIPQLNGPEAKKIRAMFSEIAGNYDLANNVLSAGIHHLWRQSLVRWSGAHDGQRVLDCATGTGDLAIEFKKAVGPLGEVIGTDFCEEMLAPAPAKAKRRGLEISFVPADVTALPYESASFNIASIAFGVRNVEAPEKGLAELARVVRPGGVVMVLEFGQPTLPVVREMYELYSHHVLPKIGGLITGRKNAYEYLQKSSARFPCGEDFSRMMMGAGQYSSCEFRTLSLGVAYMYRGVVAG